MLHKQSPRPGAFWAPGRGREGMILPVQSPNSAEQADEEAAPAHDPNPKNSRPRSDMLQGLLSFFMEKNHAFRGAAALIFCSQPLR